MNDHTTVGMIPMAIITMVFAMLKVSGIITWSWVWVFAPVWIPLAIAAIFTILAAMFGTGDSNDNKEDN